MGCLNAFFVKFWLLLNYAGNYCFISSWKLCSYFILLYEWDNKCSKEERTEDFLIKVEKRSIVSGNSTITHSYTQTHTHPPLTFIFFTSFLSILSSFLPSFQPHIHINNRWTQTQESFHFNIAFYNGIYVHVYRKKKKHFFSEKRRNRNLGWIVVVPHSGGHRLRKDKYSYTQIFNWINNIEIEMEMEWYQGNFI